MRRGHHAGHNHCGVAHPMGEGNIGIGKSRQRRELFPKLCRNKRPIEVAKGELNRKINPIGEQRTEQRTAERIEIECSQLNGSDKKQEGKDDNQLGEGETSEAQEQGGVEERALCARLSVGSKQNKVGRKECRRRNEMQTEVVERGEGRHQHQKDNAVHARADAQQMVAVVALDDHIGHECRGEQSASQPETTQVGEHPNGCRDQSHEGKCGETLCEVLAKSFLAHEEAEISSGKKLHRPNVVCTFGR